MARKLITVSEFKTYKNITNSDEDNKIDSIIISASALVKSYCSRTFIDYVKTDKVEYHDARIDTEIFLDEFPIIDIVSAEYSLDGWTTSTTLVAGDNDYFIDSELGLISAGTTTPFALGAIYNLRNFRVTYKAGYEEIPDDLKQAVLDLVEYYRSEEYTPRKSFQDMSLENLGFRETGGSKFPSHIARILSLYRRVM